MVKVHSRTYFTKSGFMATSVSNWLAGSAARVLAYEQDCMIGNDEFFRPLSQTPHKNLNGVYLNNLASPKTLVSYTVAFPTYGRVGKHKDSNLIKKINLKFEFTDMRKIKIRVLH